MSKINQTHKGARALLDAVMRAANLRNDAALARHLKRSPSTISNIRGGVTPISAEFVLDVHEIVGLPVAQIRQLLMQP